MIQTTQFGLFFELNEKDQTASIIKPLNPTGTLYASGSITIPRSITHNFKDYIIVSINSNAFKNDKNITSIEFSEDSELLTIDQDSFLKSSIEVISFPLSLRELKEGWCSYTKKLKNVKISPQNKNFLASENDDFIFGKINHSKSAEFDILLFARRDIEHVIIPSFIKCIGAHAFSECTQIKSFEFEQVEKYFNRPK